MMELKNEINLDFYQKIDFHQIIREPNLIIASRFWDEERYNAYKIVYRSLRTIDDLVDNRKIGSKISENEKEQFEAVINKWTESIKNGIPEDHFQKQLIDTIKKFQIPMWPWQRFSKSMIYDIKNDKFATFHDFIEYSEGAAIAPASIFMHFCGISKENGHYIEPKYDIRNASRSAAIFSYIVHIIRDFQKDQKDNLNYFSEDLIAESGINKEKLKEIAEEGNITPEFRNLIKKYYTMAEQYRYETEKTIKNVIPHLEPRYRLSVQIIYELYSQIFEKIDVKNGNFTTEELNPTAQEIKERIGQAISKFEKENQ